MRHTTLPAGERLGPYEIVELVGRGGMGDVYRGRDTRLGRVVAIKVLAASPASNQALQRFQQEAQAASALNHPNIVTVYDVGISDTVPFIVTELLEGETVRQAIERKHLDAAKALALTAEAATGLAVAHAKGILHRDIKPENLYITSAGVLKILDFGVSKLTPGALSIEQPAISATAPGVLIGTAGYMSPEQIRQQPLDHRTDIFSLGVVLYEALVGRAPFHGESLAETLAAVLTEDPPRPSQIRRGLTAAIDEVLRACLDKNPEDRFESAADLALTLRALVPAVAERRLGRRFVRSLRLPVVSFAIGLFVLASLVAFLLPGRGAGSSAQPTYRRATFARATITSARFRPGSGEVVYDAMINGQPRELFVTVPGTAEARPLGVRGAELLAISASGAMALSLNRQLVRGFVGTGTLAVMTEGRVPREVLENVHWADWAPDGTSLAIVRDVRGRTRLEFPMNTVLFETSGWISDPRFSPDGSRIALVDHPVNANDRGRVIVIERGGAHRVLSDDWLAVMGVAWSPLAREVWFTAQDSNGAHALRAVDLDGDYRVLAHVPARVRLLDVGRDGRVLLARNDLRLEAHGIHRGDTVERNLSWHDWSLARDISIDGRRLLITEFGEAVGATPGIYMRGMDGSPAVRLGTGSGLALSPDGMRVLSVWNNRLSLLPVGTGEMTTLPNAGVTYDPYAAFFPDGRRIVFTGAETGRAPRVYLQEIAGGIPVPITPEGFRVASPGSVSATGDTIVAVGQDENLFFCSVYGGVPRPVPGALPGDTLARWDHDGRSVFVFEPGQIPARVFRLGLNGARQPVMTLTPRDPAGAVAIHRLLMTPDGEAYAYTLERQFSDLYIAEGFVETPVTRWMSVLREMLGFRRPSGPTPH